jgi:signal transduction histidine kinase
LLVPSASSSRRTKSGEDEGYANRMPVIDRLVAAGREAAHSPSWADWLLAAGFVLAAELELALRGPGPSRSLAVTAVTDLGLLGLAWWRHLPLAAIGCLGLRGVIGAVAGGNTGMDVPVTAVFVATYALGAYAGPGQLVVGALVPLVTVAVVDTLDPGTHSLVSALPFFALFVVGAPIVVGRIIRSRTRLVDRLRRRTAQLRVEREAAAAAALAVERLDLGAELNQLVSLGVEAIVAEVKGAESMGSEQGRAVAARIEARAREVLREMRRLLVELAPAGDYPPGSARLVCAIERVRSLGVEVELTDAGAVTELPFAVDLGATRTLELLLRDPPPESRLRVDVGGDRIELEIERTIGVEGEAPVLAAVQERAALVHGKVEVGQQEDRQVVQVSLPRRWDARAPNWPSSRPAFDDSADPGPAAGGLPWPPLLAAAFFLALQVEIQISPHLHSARPLYAVGGLAVAAPLAWCRNRPVAAAAAALAAATAFSALLIPVQTLVTPIALFLVLPFCVAAFAELRWALVGLAVCTAGLASSFGLMDLVWNGAVLVLGFWAAGRFLYDRSQLAAKLARTNRQLAEERDARVRRAIVEERARMARELHDVFGHSLTVIVLQAGAARRLWASDQQRAVAALGTVARVARGALTELLRSLQSLESVVGARVGTRGLADLHAVVETARLAGLRIELEIEGAQPPLDDGLELTVYRVVQEALTNVLKHAAPADAKVIIHGGEDGLEVRVLNSLPRPIADVPVAPGRGLRGMRERVVSLGGSLEWGPCDQQRFQVRAVFPLRA